VKSKNLEAITALFVSPGINSPHIKISTSAARARAAARGQLKGSAACAAVAISLRERLGRYPGVI
jgi:hypothetical protein